MATTTKVAPNDIEWPKRHYVPFFFFFFHLFLYSIHVFIMHLTTTKPACVVSQRIAGESKEGESTTAGDQDALVSWAPNMYFFAEGKKKKFLIYPKAAILTHLRSCHLCSCLVFKLLSPSLLCHLYSLIAGCLASPPALSWNVCTLFAL